MAQSQIVCDCCGADESLGTVEMQGVGALVCRWCYVRLAVGRSYRKVTGRARRRSLAARGVTLRRFTTMAGMVRGAVVRSRFFLHKEHDIPGQLTIADSLCMTHAEFAGLCQGSCDA